MSTNLKYENSFDITVLSLLLLSNATYKQLLLVALSINFISTISV